MLGFRRECEQRPLLVQWPDDESFMARRGIGSSSLAPAAADQRAHAGGAFRPSSRTWTLWLAFAGYELLD